MNPSDDPRASGLPCFWRLLLCLCVFLAVPVVSFGQVPQMYNYEPPSGYAGVTEVYIWG
jgi:hypothetical protein